MFFKKIFLLVLVVIIVSGSFAQQRITVISTKANNYCNGTCTLLNIPELNNNPDAIIFVTALAKVPHPMAAYYIQTKRDTAQWSILNLDNTQMQVGTQFSVEYYVQPDTIHFVHVISLQNLHNNGSYIDHAGLNDNPYAQLKFFQNLAPIARGGVVNNYELKIQYDTVVHRWYMFNANNRQLSYGDGYNISIATSGNTITNPNVTTPLTKNDIPIKNPTDTAIKKTDSSCTPKVICEYCVYKECSKPEIFLIYKGRKIWIPTMDALFAMGYNTSTVIHIPDGALNNYTRYDIPSSSPTPGSLVFPPENRLHFKLDGIANAIPLLSQGKEIQEVELQGWLVNDCTHNCGDGNDSHLQFELDTDWALAHGIDLNKIFHAANISDYNYPNGSGMIQGFSPRRALAHPLIDIEINSSGKLGGNPPGLTDYATIPADWTYKTVCGLATLRWPFDLDQPLPKKETLSEGQYVRVVGSIITDQTHDTGLGKEIGKFWSGTLGLFAGFDQEWDGMVSDWDPGVNPELGDHLARQVEMHPPDLIEVLSPKEKTTTVRGVVLCARVGALPGGISNSCEQVEFDIFPEATKPANSDLAFEELRGPECYFPWGEDVNNGSWIVQYNDHIHVKARVCGGAIGGSPGRFKALYRVWWKPKPANLLNIYGDFVTNIDGNKIHYMIEPGVVSSGNIEFKLCLGAGLSWTKTLSMFVGPVAFLNLNVHDNIRCATQSIPSSMIIGQSLVFSKAKTFGQLTPVHTMTVSTLPNIPPGSRVTFTWIND